MINLLPAQSKQSIIYARRNTHLVRWVIALSLALVGAVALIGVGSFILSNMKANYDKQVAQAQQELKASNLDDTQKQLTDVSNNLKLAIQVLSKEVLFSKLLQQIGAVMPADTILQAITLSGGFGTFDINARAIDYQTATQIQINLQDPTNHIFQNVDINSIQQGAASSADPVNSKYPFQVRLTGQFGKTGSQFLFIPPAATTGTVTK